MIKAAIFDLDGTLMDSEVLWVEATELYLNDRGHAISRDDALSVVYGRSWSDIYSDLMVRFPELDETIEEMEESLRSYILKLREGRDIVIAGSVALFKQLATRMPVAIVSGSPCEDIETAIDLLGVRDDVSFSIGAEQYDPGKPDPTCFQMAAERFGVEAANCVVFEDSAAGVLAAKAAGMSCVALVRPGFPEQDVSSADLIVEDLGSFELSCLS